MKASIFVLAVTVFTTLFLESSGVPVSWIFADKVETDIASDNGSNGIFGNIEKIKDNVIGNIGKSIGIAGETVKNVVTDTTDIVGEVAGNVKNTLDDTRDAVAEIAAGSVEFTKQALSTLADYETVLGSKANALTGTVKDAFENALGDLNKELLQKPAREFVKFGVVSSDVAIAEVKKAVEEALTKATGDEKVTLTEVNDWLIELDLPVKELHSGIISAVNSGSKKDLRNIIPLLSETIKQRTPEVVKNIALLAATPGEQTSPVLVIFTVKFTRVLTHAFLDLQVLRLLELGASS